MSVSVYPRQISSRKSSNQEASDQIALLGGKESPRLRLRALRSARCTSVRDRERYSEYWQVQFVIGAR